MPVLPWMELALKEIGTLEGKGSANNPKVVAYYKDAGFPGVTQDAVAWCAAFVGAILARSGNPNTHSLMALTYEKFGVPLVTPIYGCIAVKKRKGAASWNRHVGFVVAANKEKIWLVGGNQGDAVSIAAFPRADFTAFRWLPGIALPNPPIPLPTTMATTSGAVSEA